MDSVCLHEQIDAVNLSCSRRVIKEAQSVGLLPTVSDCSPAGYIPKHHRYILLELTLGWALFGTGHYLALGTIVFIELFKVHKFFQSTCT